MVKYEFNSRLIVGSGKYKRFSNNKDATLTPGSELITVVIRRLKYYKSKWRKFIRLFQRYKCKALPNSAGCFTGKKQLQLLD